MDTVTRQPAASASAAGTAVSCQSERYSGAAEREREKERERERERETEPAFVLELHASLLPDDRILYIAFIVSRISSISTLNSKDAYGNMD